MRTRVMVFARIRRGDEEAFEKAYAEVTAKVKGTPVVVNVWATWCYSCKAEMPFLNQVATRYSTQIQFLGVDIADTLAGARAFISQHGIRYPSVFDPTQEIKFSLAVSTGSDFSGQPDTVIYRADGSILIACPGQLVQAAFLSNIQQLAMTGSNSTSCT